MAFRSNGYPRKGHNAGIAKKGEEPELTTGRKKGAVHFVSPPGQGGIARKLIRKTLRAEAKAAKKKNRK